MSTRKKKPEKPRKAKATPKLAASVAAERAAVWAFELGEQMTALRQERDEAQAELAEVVKVLDKLAPRDQYDSISAAVLEALEAHRKQRDEAARLGAIEAKAARAQLEEAQAQIASLKDAFPLGTAELQEKVAELESQIRVAYRENAEHRAVLDAVARALAGQAPGPLDAAFRVAVDVAKLRGRVKELETALAAANPAQAPVGCWHLCTHDTLCNDCPACGPCPCKGDGALYPSRARERIARIQKELNKEIQLGRNLKNSLEHWKGLAMMRESALTAIEGLLAGRTASGRDMVYRAVAGVAKLLKELGSRPSQTGTDGGTRPCRDCRHSSRCKLLLGPSYKDAGPCDWSPSRFSATGPDDATPPAAALDDLRARVQRMETALRDSEDGWGQIREWAKSDHVLQRDDGDVTVQEFADTHRRACHEAVAFEPRARQCDAAPAATNGSSVPGREDLLASSPSKLEISIRAHNALRRAGIATVRDLVALTRAEVEALRDMGKKSTDRLAEDLFTYGLTFKGDECICRDLQPPLYYVSCPHPKHRIGTVMPDRISGASEARASDAAGPEEHVHGCSRCGAHIPCSSEDPDACRERVESHCQAAKAGDAPDDS